MIQRVQQESFSSGTQFPDLTQSKKGRAQYLYMKIVVPYSDRLEKP